MPKISLLPQQTSPTVSDKVPVVSGGVTDYELLSDLITLFFNNIPSGANSPITRDNEMMFAFVASGGVWTGDSYAVNRNASMTSMVCYINGRRLSIGAVVSRTFTASKDTYIDVIDNLDGTGTLVYTEVANNVASPALAANSIRVGIIVTGATTIAAAGSVNQGQETMVLPIVSSIPYQVTDSLGNLICPRDPNRKILGHRQITTSVTNTSSTPTQILGLTCPVIVPTGRKVKVTHFTPELQNTTAAGGINASLWDGAVNGTRIALAHVDPFVVNAGYAVNPEALVTPTSASKTYNAGSNPDTTAQNTITFATTTSPAFIKVELA